MTGRGGELRRQVRSGAERVRRAVGRARRRLRRSPRRTPIRSARPAYSEGHAPVVELEHTNLGPVVDQAVLRAKQRLRVGADPDYDLVYENFDVLHYLLQQPYLLDRPEVDLVEHFLAHGKAKKLSPHPDFSMAEYLQRYPKKATSDTERSPYLVWLKRGRTAGDLADPVPRVRRMAHVLGLEPQQVVDLAVERRSDLQRRLRTGKLGEMFARAARTEPLIGEAWTEITRPRLLPLSSNVVADEIFALHEAQRAADFRPARLVFVINRGRWGGGRRIEGHLAHALAGHVEPEEIVVIYTDESTEAPPGRYPAGVREIDFAKITKDMRKDEAEHALVHLLRTFHADAIVTINSRLMYHAMRSYGHALAASERLFLVFFCNEQTGMGTWRGWSLRYFYRTFDQVAGVITDSDFLADELRKAYRMTPREREKLHAFHAPVDPEIAVAPVPPAEDGRRPVVFWAGRWDRQKRLDVFLEVARQLPDVDFRMWGENVLQAGTRELPPNVLPQGRYDHFSELPLEEADAWLYTSAWDGVPSLLLEVCMTGVPIVGTLVGGTGEVLSEEDSWPVGEHEGAEPYVRALREVLADPVEARRRGLALRERLVRERTEKAFAARAADVLLTGEVTGDLGGHPTGQEDR